MPKRRIAYIMQQPRTLQDIAYIRLIRFMKGCIPDFLYDFSRYILPQRLRQGRYFQRMSEPRPDKIASVQRKYLCFILQAAKRSASDNTVVILFEFRPQIAGAPSCSVITNPVLA